MESLVGDRRRARRLRVAEHGITAARIRPGHVVVILDISSDGALVETVYRLLPNTSVELQLDCVGERIAVRGRVLRCTVAALESCSVIYRGAILFDRALGLLDEEEEKSLPDAMTRAGELTTRAVAR